ncbi:hypothetical protein [Micromonospora sp. CPCC 206061]|uniref:hypothetical protein n=1 Tax=Micromonospora sp. CPCC 206061 TaxID=3122410 RepID=UPI002FEF97BC
MRSTAGRARTRARAARSGSATSLQPIHGRNTVARALLAVATNAAGLDIRYRWIES